MFVCVCDFFVNGNNRRKASKPSLEAFGGWLSGCYWCDCESVKEGEDKKMQMKNIEEQREREKVDLRETLFP